MAHRMRLEAFTGVDSNDEEPVAAVDRRLYRFFLYTEIDSREYAARRHRFGLGPNADIVDRAVRHFRGRCESSPTFGATAVECVADGACFDDTKLAAQWILGEARGTES
jgi:hypothetical protein